MRIRDWSSDVCSSDLAIDRQPAVPGAREGSHQIVEGDALFDRDNVRAWHADIAGVAFTEVEQVAHHLAFERREIALGVGAGLAFMLVDHLLEPGSKRLVGLVAEQERAHASPYPATIGGARSRIVRRS